MRIMITAPNEDSQRKMRATRGDRSRFHQNQSPPNEGNQRARAAAGPTPKQRDGEGDRLTVGERLRGTERGEERDSEWDGEGERFRGGWSGSETQSGEGERLGVGVTSLQAGGYQV